MLTLTHIQSLSGAKLRSGSESQNVRSLYFLAACCSTNFFEEPINLELRVEELGVEELGVGVNSWSWRVV